MSGNSIVQILIHFSLSSWTRILKFQRAVIRFEKGACKPSRVTAGLSPQVRYFGTLLDGVSASVVFYLVPISLLGPLMSVYGQGRLAMEWPNRSRSWCQVTPRFPIVRDQTSLSY